jgi:hypothetical protein
MRMRVILVRAKDRVYHRQVLDLPFDFKAPFRAIQQCQKGQELALETCSSPSASRLFLSSSEICSMKSRRDDLIGQLPCLDKRALLWSDPPTDRPQTHGPVVFLLKSFAQVLAHHYHSSSAPARLDQGRPRAHHKGPRLGLSYPVQPSTRHAHASVHTGRLDCLCLGLSGAIRK